MTLLAIGSRFCSMQSDSLRLSKSPAKNLPLILWLFLAMCGPFSLTQQSTRFAEWTRGLLSVCRPRLGGLAVGGERGLDQISTARRSLGRASRTVIECAIPP